MASRERRPRGSTDSAVSLGGIVTQETLPLPHVHYPNHYGTFLAFSHDVEAAPVLCACAEAPIRNLLRLEQSFPRPRNSDPLRMVPLSNWYFPDVIARASAECADDPLQAVSFAPVLCHRCNVATPSLRYCHEMYGGEFKQRYGWYVNQAYLRLGIEPSPVQRFTYLPEVCPAEYQAQIGEMLAAQQSYEEERTRLNALVHGPDREDIRPDEPTYWHNVRESDAAEMIARRQRSRRLSQAVHNAVENMVREEFGVPKVGEAWVSESILSQIVSRLLPDESPVRHHRPEWLEGLELDIWLPGRQAGIEYQGAQHFHAIDAWGGAKALTELRRRDARKARLCTAHRVVLVTIDHTEPLTEEYVRHQLEAQGVVERQAPEY